MRAIVVGLTLAVGGCAAHAAALPVAPSRAAVVANEATPMAPVPAAGPAEQTAVLHSLTLEGAKAAIAGAVAYARSKHTTGVIAVVDAGGNLMALERIDETFAAGAMISIGKARTAVLFKKPTRFFEELIKSGRTPMIALRDFTPLQGGIPIMIGGKIVGAIGVSGASSAAQDEELAIAGANAVGQAMAAEGPVAATKDDVVLFPHEQVAVAFQKGAPLIEQPEANLKVHASRREGPGKAEVHTRDADVIYVLDGGATLVTGGSVVDPTSVEPEEIRGASVRDGTAHRLAKGDVLVVPKGVPHWFKEVTAPFTYYVVKVRS